MLHQRYANKRVLVDTQLRLLFNQARAIQDDGASMKSLMDTTMECLNSLEKLQIETDNWDAIIIYLVTQKLTPKTLQFWEQSLTGSNELPTYKELIECLEGMYRILEAIASVKDNHVEKSNRSTRHKKEAFHDTISTCQFKSYRHV